MSYSSLAFKAVLWNVMWDLVWVLVSFRRTQSIPDYFHDLDLAHQRHSVSQIPRAVLAMQVATG
jgi:hypothetical protein